MPELMPTADGVAAEVGETLRFAWKRSTKYSRVSEVYRSATGLVQCIH